MCLAGSLACIMLGMLGSYVAELIMCFMCCMHDVMHVLGGSVMQHDQHATITNHAPCHANTAEVAVPAEVVVSWPAAGMLFYKIQLAALTSQPPICCITTAWQALTLMETPMKIMPMHASTSLNAEP